MGILPMSTSAKGQDAHATIRPRAHFSAWIPRDTSIRLTHPLRQEPFRIA
jgi:hypothetical protein